MAKSPGSAQLTRREWQVLELIATGKSNQEIADALSVAVKTVEFHSAAIYHKLGVKKRIQAIFWYHNSTKNDDLRAVGPKD